MTRKQIIQRCDISVLEEALFEDGLLCIRNASFFKTIEHNALMYFMYTYGIYVMPTEELINFLREIIFGETIEIGCGNGAIGRALKIPITDSKMQERTDIQLAYSFANQPPIKYPHDVEKLEALEAVEKYKPNTVIGAYITSRWMPGMDSGNMYGVDGVEMLKKIDRYIMIGNINTHRDNPLFKTKYKSHYFDWIITRAPDKEMNRIFVWDNKRC